jgi:hypothetical protein
MDHEIHTVEDLLESLASLKPLSFDFKIERNDATIMFSIARQISKGVALTDKQLDLVQQKLETYKHQFIEHNIDYDFAIKNLRMPLREIDRSKYIKIVTVDNPNIGNDALWIKVRFPFSKKLIVALDKIHFQPGEYVHDKGSHEHYFLLTERNTMQLLEHFGNKQFEIDEALLDWNRKLQEMKQNKKEYIPGIYNFKLKNLNDRAVKYMLSSLGEPNIDNLSLYKDRSASLGIEHIDPNKLDESINMLSTLSQRLVRRTTSHVFVNKTKYNFNNIAESLLELDRFPLLVMLPANSNDDPLDSLQLVHNSLKGFIEPHECSVLFRLDSHVNPEFNSYIKKEKLNTTLDKSLKVVYINNNKIPKPLLRVQWRPLTVLMMDSVRPSTVVSTYIEQANLVIHFDETMSQVMRFDKNGIQEL